MNSNIFSFYETYAKEEPDSLKVVIQPAISCHGWPTNAGSMALERYIALEDATVIRLLKKTGARIVGSTRMSELGLGLAGDTGNQAIRENFADVALIIDNMGEARASAAYGGFTGFKPSYGIVSRSGLIGLIPSMECPGILARDLTKIRDTMKIICMSDDRDFSMIEHALPDFRHTQQFEPSSQVIGVMEGFENDLTKTESLAWQTAISVMEKAGFRVEKIQMSHATFYSQVHNVIGAVEASSSAGKYDGVRYGHRAAGAGNWNEMYLKSRGESFGTLMKAYLFQGAYFQFENYAAFEKACRIRKYLADETLEIFNRVKWMASMTIRENPNAFEVSDIDATYKAFSFTLPASIMGLPSIQLPGIAMNGSRDFGLQITGCSLSDSELLSLAAFFGPKDKGGPTK